MSAWTSSCNSLYLLFTIKTLALLQLSNILQECFRLLISNLKQEEVENCVRLQDHEFIAVTEPWWDRSHDWNAVVDGYTLFRKNRPTR